MRRFLPHEWDTTTLNHSAVDTYLSAPIPTAESILTTTGPSNPEVISGESALNFVMFVCVNRFSAGRL